MKMASDPGKWTACANWEAVFAATHSTDVPRNIQAALDLAGARVYRGRTGSPEELFDDFLSMPWFAACFDIEYFMTIRTRVESWLDETGDARPIIVVPDKGPACTFRHTNMYLHGDAPDAVLKETLLESYTAARAVDAELQRDEEDEFMIGVGFMSEAGEVYDVESVLMHECPHCGQLISRDLYATPGNTAGKRDWPDGRSFFAIAPASEFAVKCPSCRNILWLNRTKIASRARPYVLLDADEYTALLSVAIGTGEREFWIRMNLWWAANDRREKEGGALNATETENLEALVKLAELPDFLRDEVLQQLGE